MTPAEQKEALRAEARRLEASNGRARGPGKTKSLLPTQPPPPEAPAPDLCEWLTAALNLRADPIVAVVRYGRSDDARLVATLRSDQRIVYDRQADCFQPDTLIRRVVLVAGAQPPAYGRADALAIATSFIRAAELKDDTDDRLEARDWGRTFLEEAQPLGPHDFSTPEGRWRGLCALREWRPAIDHPMHPPAQRAGALHTEDGTVLVRVNHFAAHVRATTGRAHAWGELHTRMIEAGWEHRGEVQQRNPHGRPGKTKLRLYAIPAGWDD